MASWKKNKYFFESVKHAYSHVTTTLLPCVTPSGGENMLNMLDGVQFWTPGWPVHDLCVLLFQKISGVTWCLGRDIVLNIHKVSSKNARRTRNHIIAEKPDLALATEGFFQHHHFTPPTTENGTHNMTEGPPLPSVGWMHASISVSPCLWCTWARSSLWNNVKWNSSLSTQCIQYLGSKLLCVLPHTRWCRLKLKGNLGNLAGHLDR